MTTEQQIQLIKMAISPADYNRACFLMRNVDTIGAVRRNLFCDYMPNELMMAAYRIITNYERPTYTFDRLNGMVKPRVTARMLKSAIPEWRRAIDTWFNVRNAVAGKMTRQA